MISDQHSETSNGNVETPVRGLTVEESFFLELLQKKEKPVIKLKFTPKGEKVGNLEPFSNYYSESEIIRLLDSLVSKKALFKQEKGTVLLCPKCGGHANMAVLVCPRCGSTKISRKEGLNHVECEYWGPREEFVDGVLLRCPRCDELLMEHADEGTSNYFTISDPYFECQDCGTSMSKNNLAMVCIKCSNKYNTVQASYLNSVSYTLAQGVSVKPQSEIPKSIQQKMKKKNTPELVENKEPVSNPESEPARAQKQGIPKYIDRVLVREPEIEEKAEIVESPDALKKIRPNALPDSEDMSDPGPELKIEPDQFPEPNFISEPKIETRFIQEPDPLKEKEPISKAEVESFFKKKKKKSDFQTPINRLSEMFKKKPKTKPEKKKKAKNKTTLNKKPKLKQEFEPKIEEEKYESYELEENIIEPEPDKIQSEEKHNLEEHQPEMMKYETKPIPLNNLSEVLPKSKFSKKDDLIQILLVVENVSVSEFVIESLERVKKPINVLHIEDGHMALKELKLKYDALILDYELKSIEAKFILSEMEKWGIMMPIIVLSDEVLKLDKYILNIEAVLKKKQRAIHKISGILRKLL